MASVSHIFLGVEFVWSDMSWGPTPGLVSCDEVSGRGPGLCSVNMLPGASGASQDWGLEELLE